MKVPFTDSNTEQKPIPQNVFLTMGPAPLQPLVNIIAQVESQGWTTRVIPFAGMTPTGLIALKQQTMIPVYYAVICKVFNEGEELIEPVIKEPVTKLKDS